MKTRPRRLVVAGSVIVDVIMPVPQLPSRGGDVMASSATAQAGGGFNVLAAAARLGLSGALAGRLGTGPFAGIVAAALIEEGVTELIPRVVGEQGFCVGMVEPDGERTFVTSAGVESELTREELSLVTVRPDDVVFVSGYDLTYPGSGPALAGWLAEDVGDALVVIDPGPLVAEIPEEVADAAFGRADVLSLNTREFALLSGELSPVADPKDIRGASAVLDLVRPDGFLVLRDGPRGSHLIRPDRESIHFPAPVIADVVDTTGAGDAHTGALLAELAQGKSVEEAVRVATVAAALSVRQPISAAGPTREELEDVLAA
ncbi:Sugar or nucleoside kinase, ribokinase family [Austwickia chelonae]|uniref:Carbohydrate kinase PfkB domain-containing protein n=1 Tax=Austwickia chelonae NBRC 105200 TaxID=1184607 RepID=K6V8Q1_9MICO|nr:PfkB family carbohydrate kinase [Austwickia chelonae]GAB78593.1 hypothetical protein AUCHE_16_00090 [Austwickia chelonae NBRC 105200]SEW33993.1 Sugar or nucleoside kinase, ribokinase family [Austwickia chelonae]